MKKLSIISVFLVLFMSVSVSAQNPDKQLPIEQLLDADAKHNLDVAWQYFRLRKAYIAVLLRTEETMAAHPTFSKMDEILYLSGMSSYYLSKGKGKQKIDLTKLPEDERDRWRTERLTEDAVAFLGQLIEEHPESKYASKAKKTYNKIRPPDKK